MQHAVRLMYNQSPRKTSWVGGHEEVGAAADALIVFTGEGFTAVATRPNNPTANSKYAVHGRQTVPQSKVVLKKQTGRVSPSAKPAGPRRTRPRTRARQGFGRPAGRTAAGLPGPFRPPPRLPSVRETASFAKSLKESVISPQRQQECETCKELL